MSKRTQEIPVDLGFFWSKMGYRTVLWTLWERERVGRYGRMAMKHVKYHV